MLNDALWQDIAGVLTADDFSLEKHRRIYKRMADLYSRCEHIDRITVYSELDKAGEVESCDGLGYLISLDDGLPQVPNVDSYVRLVKEAAILRQTIFAAQGLIQRCLSCDPASDCLGWAEKALSSISDRTQPTGEWLSAGEVIEGYPGGLNAFLSPAIGGIGIPTPWAPLTEVMCGLHREEMLIVAGRPSMGKSIVLMQMAYHAAKEGNGAAVFSLEMSKESLVQRMIADHANIDAQRLRSGKLNQEERRRAMLVAGEIAELPLWIDDTRARTVAAMSTRLRTLRAKHEVRFIGIDHLQEMIGDRRQNRHMELSEMVRDLHHEAKVGNATMVLLSQLSRKCEEENRRPQLSDLRESGSIEEVADAVLFVHRPERYIKNRDHAELRGVAEFILAKQRNGPTGKIEMVFLDTMQRFALRAQDYGDRFQEGTWTD
jgi:replicative DNA helicase